MVNEFIRCLKFFLHIKRLLINFYNIKFYLLKNKKNYNTVNFQTDTDIISSMSERVSNNFNKHMLYNILNK